MFTRRGQGSAFDSVSLVEMEVKQHPVDGHPHLKLKLCYVDSKSGHTFGHIDLQHAPYEGLEILSKEAFDAWVKFVAAVEKDQGQLLFGEGQVTQLNMFGENNSQAESTQDMTVGLGGGG